MSEENDKLYFAADFGQRIQGARKRVGLTLDAVGAALGITGGAVSRWESESSLPSRKNLKAFSELVNANFVWLQTGLHPPACPGDVVLTPPRFYLICERREDGGLRVMCPEVPGLALSHKDPHAVMRDVIPAINAIMRHNDDVTPAARERQQSERGG